MKTLYFGDPVYYDPDFQTYLLDYKDLILKEHANPIKIDDVTQHQFFGDFNGLLKRHGVPPTEWWVTLKINGLESSHGFQDYLPYIYIVDSAYIAKRLEVYKRLKKED